MKICICTTPIRPIATSFPPFGSIAVIQALRNIGEQVNFYHIDYHRYTYDQNSKYFATNQFDMVGISAVVSTAYAYTKNLIELIKKVSPKTIIFVGGNLAASAEILHRKANADYCIIGDGEIIAQNLVKTIKDKKTTDDDLNKIRGITFINSKNVFRFTGYDTPLTADKIEMPDFSILEDENCLDHYMPEPNPTSFGFDPKHKFKKGERQATVVFSKGCVARCTFCHRFEKGYRVIPIETIKNHLKMLMEKYNVKYIHVGDENFGSYKKETIKLVDLMGSLNLTWRSNGVRAHTMDLEMLKHWKKNGCGLTTSGIESGSPTILKVMEKKVSLEKNIDAIRSIYKADMATVIQLVIGMPGETDKTIDETIDFLLKVMPYYSEIHKNTLDLEISINYAQALPGTPLYEYAREYNYVGKDVNSEEEYLLKISDKDAYDNDHFLNYTQQPLLKVLGWRAKILWKLFPKHAKANLKISPSKLMIIMSLFIISINKIFKANIGCHLTEIFSKFDKSIQKNPYSNASLYSTFQYGLKLLIPWNKFTYPFLMILVAFKERKNTRWFFKLILDHIVWNLNLFKKINLPKITLRKIVNINDIDETLEIRRGR